MKIRKVVEIRKKLKKNSWEIWLSRLTEFKSFVFLKYKMDSLKGFKMNLEYVRVVLNSISLDEFYKI